MERETIAEAVGVEKFPPGLGNAFLFAGFNALSFQIVLGSPMVLYAKALGASATVLGIVAGMMPLLVIFQIPAASHIPRIGYKRFVYGGWGIRVLFICGMAFVPALGGFLNRTTQLALILFLLFCFNLSRGISSCAWLPWITSLIPPDRRGDYLAREAGCVNLASCVAFLFAGYLLGNSPRPWQFAALFGFSALMGMISLIFLKRIPEGESPEQHRASTTPVPWLAISRYAPFRKLLWMNVAWSVAYGGLSTFTVAFLRTEMALLEGTILKVNSAAFLGGLASLWLLRSSVDRVGSKPILLCTLFVWMGIVAGWDLLAGRVVQLSLGIIVVLQIAMGMGAAAVTMANTRLAMATIPVMGRNHFFALFSVVGSLTLGLAPIVWGLVIDGFSFLEWTRYGFEWNRYSVFFTLVLGAFFVALVVCNRLDEPKAARMDVLLRQLLVESPQRVWLRFWPRS